MKVWISKYALTKGIFEIDVEDDEYVAKGMVTDRRNPYRASYHGEGREWHRARADAVVRAKQMQRDKLRSLQKQIDKVKAIDFGGAV